MKLVAAVIAIAAAALIGMDGNARYRGATRSESQQSPNGLVQTLVPQAVDGVVTRVGPGVRSTGNTVAPPWHSSTRDAGEGGLEIAVILPEPPSEPPKDVIVVLSGQGPAPDQVIETKAGGVDDHTGHAVAEWSWTPTTGTTAANARSASSPPPRCCRRCSPPGWISAGRRAGGVVGPVHGPAAPN